MARGEAQGTGAEPRRHGHTGACSHTPMCTHIHDPHTTTHNHALSTHTHNHALTHEHTQCQHPRAGCPVRQTLTLPSRRLQWACVAHSLVPPSPTPCAEPGSPSCGELRFSQGRARGLGRPAPGTVRVRHQGWAARDPTGRTRGPGKSPSPVQALLLASRSRARRSCAPCDGTWCGAFSAPVPAMSDSQVGPRAPPARPRG